ncbi:hypothetical protein J2X36_000811 [Methylobacterium sp. BE186]|uniref:hypothetical protein n=1 Tax=Methylobacterium sp. BE186 TaxID=2817715 RepID=UPI00286277F3|nr:hypothetical protein [Methylobacterium sp. BE186]MDR7036075.1 hypothetical protein [Methylobacterium sp. BE186]
MTRSIYDQLDALDRLIAEGEKRHAGQVARIEQLNENGQCATGARGMLQNIKTHLAALRARRAQLQIMRTKS